MRVYAHNDVQALETALRYINSSNAIANNGGIDVCVWVQHEQGAGLCAIQCCNFVKVCVCVCAFVGILSVVSCLRRG